LDVTRLHRLNYLNNLKQLEQTEPGSMRYNLALKVKRNYVYEAWFVCEFITNIAIYGVQTTQEHLEPPNTDKHFEMARDFLLPEVDFEFREQAQMRSNPQRNAQLKPSLARLQSIMEKVKNQYFE